MASIETQLLPGERLILSEKQHPLVLLRPLVLLVVSLAITVALALATGLHWLVLFAIAPALYLLWEWLSRQRTFFVVTNRRVFRQEGVFETSSFDSPLDKINNVFHAQTLAGRVFGYGRVGLETASEQGMTIIESIPDPIRFKNAIIQQRELYRPGYSGEVSAETPTDIPRMLEQLASLRDRGILTAEDFESKKKALLARL